MVALLCLLFELVASPFKSKSRLEAENATLRQQLAVLRRKVQGRVQFRSGDRLFFIYLYRWFPSVLKAITIIRPETIVCWHRAGFHRYWRWKSRSVGGRPQISGQERAGVHLPFNFQLIDASWEARSLALLIAKRPLMAEGEVSRARCNVSRVRNGASKPERALTLAPSGCGHAFVIAGADGSVCQVVGRVIRHTRIRVAWSKAGKPTVPIYALLKSNGSFEPEEVALLGNVFEDVLQTLGFVDREDPLTVMVAKGLVEYAKTGIRDPARLKALTVQAFTQQQQQQIQREQQAAKNLA